MESHASNAHCDPKGAEGVDKIIVPASGGSRKWYFAESLIYVLSCDR